MKRFSSIAALTALLLTAAACGDDEASTSTSTSTSTNSVKVTDTVPSADAPMAIISLSPTHTEMLFAIGAADQIIAVDDQSNYPAAALDKPHELSGFEPNVEAIAALKPDLVVIADDGKDLTGQLGKLGIPVWSGPAPTTFDDVYAQIEQLGAATGHIGEAAEVVGQMQTDITAAVVAAPVMAEPATFYHELDPTLYSVTSSTFIGQVYGLFGLVNLANGVEKGNDYPQLNAEFIIAANPDYIFLADSKCCGQSPETVAARDGWAATNAVINDNVIAIDDDIASRWGPRLVDFIQAVSTALSKVPAQA
ncbi:MAG TPA: ABC transporter substrate-binding protein [Ilumatobacteraceae bacterium]|nr:ABC transporter substrate-binding protein [Ilumatobacteraceae bacterium]HRB05153.1 ABC transporter substrate-binding protein [Ilumatobacteraceae bacterium]